MFPFLVSKNSCCSSVFIIIIINIIFIIIKFYVRNLQRYTQSKPCLQGVYFCSHSTATVCTTCNDISNDKHFVLLYQFLQYVCSARYDCFLQFFNFEPSGMLLRYFLNDFNMVPVATDVLVSHWFCTFHMRCASSLRSLFFGILPVTLW